MNISILFIKIVRGILLTVIYHTLKEHLTRQASPTSEFVNFDLDIIKKQALRQTLMDFDAEYDISSGQNTCEYYRDRTIRNASR